MLEAFSTVRELPEPDFPHERQFLEDAAESEDRRAQLCEFIYNRGEPGMDQLKYHLIQHVKRTRHVYGFVFSGEFSKLTSWAESANAFIFGHPEFFLDPQGRVLLDDGGSHYGDGTLPYPVDALERKTRHALALGERDIHVVSTLPPVVGEPEVELRTPEEVYQRCLGLVTVAVRAESALHSPPVIRAAELYERFPGSAEALTRKETLFIRNLRPDPHDATQFLWRYEALHVLLWALNAFDDLEFPSGICDPAACVNAMLTAKEPKSLRSVAEILDALDLHYRLHWATREARVHKTPVPADLESGVVLERHYTLNWLTCHQNAAWDEVDTST